MELVEVIQEIKVKLLRLILNQLDLIFTFGDTNEERKKIEKIGSLIIKIL